MTARSGFSLMEMLIVIILAGIVAGTALPSVGRSLAELRLQRAATVLAADMRLAHSTAARRRQPVQLTVDPATKIVVARSWPTTTTTYTTSRFDATSDYAVREMTASPASSVVLYPSGLSSAAITVTLTAAGKTRTVHMTRAGQIRIN